MATTLSASNLYNSFNVFREILQGITAFTTIFPGAHFEDNDRYFEEEPNTKSRNFIGFPWVVIETTMDDEHISYTNLKQMNCSTNVVIYTEYSVERDTPRLNSYLNAITNYVNTNQTTLLNTYGIVGIRIGKTRERDEIAERQLVVGTLTFDYNLKLDVEA